MVRIEEVSEAEAAAASAAASSAEDHHRWKYDVFLSFRGEDIRKTFIDHLYSTLVRSGIYTFKDDERLETGESIPPPPPLSSKPSRNRTLPSSCSPKTTLLRHGV
ncbi:hypothetical protein LguiA_007232 [Lonicera macranthoides]